MAIQIKETVAGDHPVMQLSRKDVHFGDATICFGKKKDADEFGWFAPGGEFTTDRSLAEHWARKLDFEIKLCCFMGDPVGMLA